MKRIGEMIEALLARCKRGHGVRCLIWRMRTCTTRMASREHRGDGAACEDLRGRYVRVLEDEVARLRAENRALLNSLLGTVGVPPLSARCAARSAGERGAAPFVAANRDAARIAGAAAAQRVRRRRCATPPPARM